MSLIASAVKTNDSSFSLSQEIDLPDKDNYVTATISETDNFDLSDKTFPLIFLNIKPCQYTNISSKTNDTIFLHVNICSFLKNYDELYQFVSELRIKSLTICITVTKLKGIPDVNISLPGYLFIHENSSTNAGGVGIYISKILCFEKIFNSTFPDSESLWIKVKSPNFSISHVIGTIYRHPTKNIKEFAESLSDILSEINKSHANYFILGDLNINTNYSSDYLNIVTSNSVTSLTTKLTATIIDHVLTNENRLILTPFVMKYTLINHYPIMIFVSQKTNNTCKNQYKLVRSFSKFSVEKFIKDLQTKLNEVWQKIPTITDKNNETIFEQFYILITQNIDKHVSLKKIQ